MRKIAEFFGGRRKEGDQAEMKVEEFQKFLSQITEKAKEKKNILTVEEIKVFFAGSGLDSEQMKKVLQYLKLQGISIEGMEHIYKEGVFSKTEGVFEKTAEPDRKSVPLSVEEREYLAGYRRDLEGYLPSESSPELLFQKLSRGERQAQEDLIRYYLPVAADLSEAENCVEIPFPDLLAEANMSLVAALKEEGPEVKNDAWVRQKILEGIRLAVEEQSRRNFSDDYLVSKVEKLDRTIRELEDGEEGEKSSFSVQDLSIILDMNEEEIRDVLRLAGGGEQ